jgi:glyoxalase family protein
LSLVDDRGAGAAFPWTESPVPAEHQIRGLGYTTITVPVLEPTHRFLTEALGLRADHRYPLADAPEYDVHVYAIGGGGAHAEVHVIVRDDLPRARYGAGGVHHVALRVPDGQRMEDWVGRLDALGYRNSGIVDRHYFTSAYVREPNHVLFELATDGPGFEVDGPLDGERLSLPPFLEPRRREIEAKLVPLANTNTIRA